MLQQSQQINKGQFTSRRFHEEEFRLFMSEPDPSVHGLEFIYSAYHAAINNLDTLLWSVAMRASDADQFKALSTGQN
jgi:hypothetical protein